MSITLKAISEAYQEFNPNLEMELHKEYEVDERSYSFHGENIVATINNVRLMDHSPEGESVFITKSKFSGLVFTFHKDQTERDLLLKEWGPYRDLPQGLPHQDATLVTFIRQYLAQTDGKHGTPTHEYNISRRIGQFRPIRSLMTPGNVAIYQTREKLQADKQTSMAPGKAFGKMFPELSQDQISVMVDMFREEFSNTNLTLHSGKTEEDFTKPYRHTMAQMSNPRTTSYRKSLANSCMQKPFSDFPHHPASAYDSGDFTIIWAETEQGHIASRCVVYTAGSNGWQAGPIYGTCEHSINLIEDELKKNNATLAENASWVGAQLSRRQHNGGFIGAYLDLHPQCADDNGDFLIIEHHGDVDCSKWQGVFTDGPEYCCENCGEGLCEDTLTIADDQVLCEHCLFENYTYCEYSQEWVHDSDTVEAYSMSGDRILSETISQYAADNEGNWIWADSRGEYWEDSDVMFCEYTEEYITQACVNEGDYFKSDGDDEYYPTDQKAVMADGSTISIDEKDELMADEA